MLLRNSTAGALIFLSVACSVVKTLIANLKQAKKSKKAKQNRSFRLKKAVFLELLPRFELGTSSLPKSIGIFCGVSIHFNLYQLILAAQGVPLLTATRSSSLILSNFRAFVGRFVGKHLSHPHAKTHPFKPHFPKCFQQLAHLDHRFSLPDPIFDSKFKMCYNKNTNKEVFNLSYTYLPMLARQ